ncbi:MAG: leucine-rich repeat domain-containing protein, partial [Verrucomicrobiae bacterium]|nr:leucine-rich repeat domain-containing protein [Verrucomicrobiae bacterium]
MTTLEGSAFSKCRNLTGITLSDNLAAIPEMAFWQCSSLESVSIPGTVASIENSAFTLCDSLTRIEVSDDNPAFSSRDGVLFDKAQTYLIQRPQGRTGGYTIPETVTTIGSYAFVDCPGLRTMSIPASVTTISPFAFQSCFD